MTELEHHPLCESNYDLETIRYKCQFCGRSSPIAQWKNQRQTCPHCGKDYDAQLAHDSEE